MSYIGTSFYKLTSQKNYISIVKKPVFLSKVLLMRLIFLFLIFLISNPIYSAEVVSCGDSTSAVLEKITVKAKKTEICEYNKNYLKVVYTDKSVVMYPGIKGSKCTLFFNSDKLEWSEGCNKEKIEECKSQFGRSNC